MKLYTIGFGGHTAEQFFEKLKAANIRRLIDIRLRPNSQLSGFAKQDHLPYLLRTILDVEYLHELRLAPSDDLLDRTHSKKITWSECESAFQSLLRKRKIADVLKPSLIAPPSVLLCSEHSPDKCHRRLVAEYLAREWGKITVVHL